MSEEKKGGDFRYAVGEAKVPWHAVGEFYEKDDVLEVIKFLLPGNGEQYDSAINNIAKNQINILKNNKLIQKPFESFNN